MRILVTPLFCTILLTQVASLRAADAPIRRAVVKVYSTLRLVNLSSPWKRETLKSVSGSGVWIGDGRILTAAHVVHRASQISIQPYESSERISAQVAGTSPEMDLAVLKIDDVSQFGDLAGLRLMDSLPEIRSTVQVYGYPTGGTSQSVTEGIVSRIEYSTYKYDARGLLLQIDAALNSGNSGGPAVVDDKIIGIAFRRLGSAENIGYLIPSEEVQTFLADIDDGEYDGKAYMMDQFQNLQNRALRDQYGLDSDTTGVLMRVPYSDAADYPLKAGDIITHVGEYEIDNTGIVRTKHNLRVSFQYVVSFLESNGQVPVTVLRDGQTMKLTVPIRRHPDLLIPPLKARFPSYFVYGPLVFTEATENYLDGVDRLLTSSKSQTRASAARMLKLMQERRSPLITRRYDVPQFQGEQLVMVVSRLLPHQVSEGYRSTLMQVLESVNGTKIKNMRHLVETLRELKSEQVSFEFFEDSIETLVFNREEIMSATEDILTDNAIHKQCSPDLEALWLGAEAQ